MHSYVHYVLLNLCCLSYLYKSCSSTLVDEWYVVHKDGSMSLQCHEQVNGYKNYCYEGTKIREMKDDYSKLVFKEKSKHEIPKAAVLHPVYYYCVY